jgi:hypothetical protein
MPTYYALGVKATLATCALQESISNVINLQMKEEQRNDAARYKEVLDGATPLLERGIGVDGEGVTQGGPQFIGAKADMPMKMVEAGMTLKPPKDFLEWDGSDEDMDRYMEVINPYAVADEIPSSSVDLPLTSVGATPTPTQLKFVTGSHALVLNISLSAKAFVPDVWKNDKGHEVKDNKDLKVEIVRIPSTQWTIHVLMISFASSSSTASSWKSTSSQSVFSRKTPMSSCNTRAHASTDRLRNLGRTSRLRSVRMPAWTHQVDGTQYPKR